MAGNAACAARSGCGNGEPWEVVLLSAGMPGHGVKEGMMNWACRKAWIGNPCGAEWFHIRTAQTFCHYVIHTPAVAAISQISPKYSHTLCTAAQYNHWQYFSVAVILHSRFGKKPHQNQVHYPFVHPQTLYHVQNKIRDLITGQLWGPSSACNQTEFAGLKDLAEEAKRQSSGTTSRGEVSLSSTGST